MKRTTSELGDIAQALFEQLPITKEQELFKPAQSTEIVEQQPHTYPRGAIGSLLAGFYYQGEYGSTTPLSVFIEELNAFSDEPLGTDELWLVGGALGEIWQKYDQNRRLVAQVAREKTLEGRLITDKGDF